jgi:hypothetical protein
MARIALMENMIRECKNVVRDRVQFLSVDERSRRKKRHFRQYWASMEKLSVNVKDTLKEGSAATKPTGWKIIAKVAARR